MRMSADYSPTRGQTSLEYLLLLAVVAVVVIASFGPGSLISQVHDSAQDYYKTVTRAIMGENPQPINGGWCPIQCPSGSGPTTIYQACECPAPAFGGASCAGSGSVSCSGTTACGPCPPGQVCNSAGNCVCANNLDCSSIPNSSPDPTCTKCECWANYCWNGFACVPGNDCTCAPNCLGKNCGADDGCGGACLTGNCPFGQHCTVNGCESLCLACQTWNGSSCVTTTPCGSNNCGFDSCNNSCGTCPPPGQPTLTTCSSTGGSAGICVACGDCIVSAECGSNLGTSTICGSVCIGTANQCTPPKFCQNDTCTCGACVSNFECGPLSTNPNDAYDSCGNHCIPPCAAVDPVNGCSCNSPQDIASGDTTCNLAQGICVCTAQANSCASNFECGPLSASSGNAYDSCGNHCTPPCAAVDPVNGCSCNTPQDISSGDTTCNNSLGICVCTPLANSCVSNFECGPLSASSGDAYDSCGNHCTPPCAAVDPVNGCSCNTPQDIASGNTTCNNSLGTCGCTPVKACPVSNGCGTDSCQKSCGTCPNGEACNVTDGSPGSCICVTPGICPPGAVCGPDTCGNPNGCNPNNPNPACTVNQICTAGKCVCVPNCPAGSTCATDDGCGGKCVTCTGNMTCQSGVCACTSIQTDCNNTCVNLNNDNNNCGSCGNACTGGMTCQNGVCACPAGETNCGGTCVNEQNDNNNCGSCGNVCPAGKTCENGVCVCTPNICPTGAVCGPDTCGNPDGCGTCPGGETCSSSGLCTATYTVHISDYANCRTCSAVCSSFHLAGECGQLSDCNGKMQGCVLNNSSFSPCVQNPNDGTTNCGACVSETITAGSPCVNGINYIYPVDQSISNQLVGQCGNSSTQAIPESADDTYQVVCK